jgi:hypothetical protein
MLIVKIGEAPEAAIVVSVVSPLLTAIVVSELDDLEPEPPHAANALVAASDKSAIDVIFRIEVMGTFQKLRQRGEAVSGRRQNVMRSVFALSATKGLSARSFMFMM